MSEGILSLNADGKIPFLNSPMENLLGIVRQQHIVRHYDDLFPNATRNFEIHELTEDEVFCTEDAAKAGVVFENTSEVEPLVVLRYFGPEMNPDAPAMGAYRKNKFN